MYLFSTTSTYTIRECKHTHKIYSTIHTMSLLNIVKLMEKCRKRMEYLVHGINCGNIKRILWNRSNV